MLRKFTVVKARKFIIYLILLIFIISFQTASMQSWKELYTKISKYTQEMIMRQH